jgi:hypothetical protein
MLRLRRVLLAACVIALAAPARALATPINNTPPTITNVYGSSGPPAVGSTVECNPGTRTSSTGGGSLFPEMSAFSQDSTSGTQVASVQGGYMSQTPTGTDAGHTLVCAVTTDDWSDGQTVTVVTSPTAIVLWEPTVTVTQYSPVVSGNIGEPVRAVGVAVMLERYAGGASPWAISPARHLAAAAP